MTRIAASSEVTALRLLEPDEVRCSLRYRSSSSSARVTLT